MTSIRIFQSLHKAQKANELGETEAKRASGAKRASRIITN